VTPATAGMGRTDANRTDAGRTDAGRTDGGPIGALRRMGIVPVVVIDEAGQAAPLAEALLETGIAGAEVTLRTPAALGALAVMTRYPGFVAGAGAVLDQGQVAAAADAGAQYGVSPGVDPDIVAACLGRSLPVLPGAVTATEIQQVRRAGLRACKFFRAGRTPQRDRLRVCAHPANWSPTRCCASRHGAQERGPRTTTNC
jgi:2-dehydro-3-deoxyphosphogluconate aldolase / (4S)-4-hydroxy-2-oxoglutarate aldolase